jgi:aminomethyltransferase
MNTAQALRRTPLYKIHEEAGGKLVPFCGWELPIQYTSIMKEHQTVRSSCGLFDVSHMGQVTVEGPQALDFLQKINANDVSKLVPGRALYSHMLNERGGVVDDVIISQLGPQRYFIVVNAATTEKDFAWMSKHAKGLKVQLANRSDEYGMVAIQGPKAETILSGTVPGVTALKRFGAMECRLYGQNVVITRTGYTGEDGFEVIAPPDITPRIWQTLLANGASFGTVPVGLGARDTLRLEAGYLLYGSDVDDDHSTFEANYGWVVKMGKKDFIGKAALEAQLKAGLKRKLLGVKLLERGVPRHGAMVLLDDKPLGELASATFSPTLNVGIGMGYLSQPDLQPGRKVAVELHGRRVPAEIAPIPFYKRPQ